MVPLGSSISSPGPFRARSLKRWRSREGRDLIGPGAFLRSRGAPTRIPRPSEVPRQVPRAGNGDFALAPGPSQACRNRAGPAGPVAAHRPFPLTCGPAIDYVRLARQGRWMSRDGDGRARGPPARDGPSADARILAEPNCNRDMFDLISRLV